VSLARGIHLSVTYRSTTGQAVPALREINFEIAVGEIAGVLGESGCGKSTLARVLLDLLPPGTHVEGELFFRGQSVLGQKDKTLRALRGAKISLVHQEPGLSFSPFLRIGTQIEEVLRAHSDLSSRARHAEVQETLREVQLSDVKRIYDAYPHQLSGGQLHRAAIAQALVCCPDLLIADEITRSLDENTQAEILSLLKWWNEKFGTAILFITHNPALLAELAGRVLVMYEGRIVESGPVAEVFRQPYHDYTKQLLQLVPQAQLSGAHAATSFLRFPKIVHGQDFPSGCGQ
jgi:ABC-type dipeptide/oligopeptide/nickel transport system ATPase component